MPNLTFQEWKAFSEKKRRRLLRLLEQSDDEDSPVDLFAAIAPPLRVVDFETSVSNWQAMQTNFEQLGAANATWSTQSSRTSLVGDVLTCINDMRAAQTQQTQQLQLITDRLASLEMSNTTLRQENLDAAFMQRVRIPMYDVCRISGQAALMHNIQPFATIALPPLPILLPYKDMDHLLEKTYIAEDPDYDNQQNQAHGYEVFKVIDDYEHTLQRFFIQPYSSQEVASLGTGFNSYRQAIEHFIDRNRSPIAHLMEAGATLSVTFHTQIEGVDRNFTFREYPGSDKTLQDYITMVYSEDG